MQPSVLLVLSGILLLLAAVYLRGWALGRQPMSQRLAQALIGATLLAATALTLMTAFSPWGRQWGIFPPAGGDDAEPATAGSPAELLAVGQKAPPLMAEGWLNGTPTSPGRVVVVDIWIARHAGCREAAPGLVQLFHKYRDRDVGFVSLTNAPREVASEFIEQNSISWPCGYAATRTIAGFGALSPDRKQAGYEVDPAFFVINAKGRIRWNDRRTRLDVENLKELLHDLEVAIDQALAEDAESRVGARP